MKKKLLFILFLFFSLPIFSQVLKDPTLERFGTANAGNLLVVNTWNEIWKSTISVDDINNIRKELSEAKSIINKQREEIEKTKRTISSQERLINEQKREINDMNRTINQLIKDVDNLKRKIK